MFGYRPTRAVFKMVDEALAEEEPDDDHERAVRCVIVHGGNVSSTM